MRRITFSIVLLGLMSLTVCGITRATPIAPLVAEIAGNSGAANITPVYYYRHWHHRYGGHDPWDWYRVDRPGRGINAESQR